jgi:L-asparagine transporter-like permease
MKLIKSALQGAIELVVILLILLGGAIGPGLLSGANSTIVLPHQTIRTETTP